MNERVGREGKGARKGEEGVCVRREEGESEQEKGKAEGRRTEGPGRRVRGKGATRRTSKAHKIYLFKFYFILFYFISIFFGDVTDVESPERCEAQNKVLSGCWESDGGRHGSKRGNEGAGDEGREGGREGGKGEGEGGRESSSLCWHLCG